MKGKILDLIRKGFNKGWSLLNTNVGGAISGAIVSGWITNRFTKSYKNEQLRELITDVSNLTKDLKEKEDNANKLIVSNEGLRNKFIVQSNELSEKRIDLFKCESYITKYKSAYDKSYCFFREPIKNLYISSLKNKENINNNENNFDLNRNNPIKNN